MNTIKIGNDDEAEVIVCAEVTTPLYLPDNLVGSCFKCFRGLQVRPSFPRHLKLVCMTCASPHMNAAFKANKLHMIMTPESAAEYLKFMHKKRQH